MNPNHTRPAPVVRGILAALGLAAALPALADLPTTLDLSPSLTLASLGTEPARTDSVVVAEAEPSWLDTGYRWKGTVPVAAEPDWRGLQRDTLYFMFYQVAAIGVIYALPESISNWREKDKEDIDLETWRHNVSHPEWDDDAWWINYLTHPYWGAAYYIRGRERGLDRGQSFLFSVGLSTLYEYWLEPFFEPVSLQDMIATPVLGALVGEYVFTPVRDRIRAQPGEPSWSDKTLLFLTDPLGVIGSWTDRMLGVESSVTLQPLGPSVRTLDSGLAPVQARLVDAQRPWGVQMQVAW